MPITEYMGDGVYATIDTQGITLDLRGQDDTTVIVMEPEVWDTLTTFVSRYMTLSDWLSKEATESSDAAHDASGSDSQEPASEGCAESLPESSDP